MNATDVTTLVSPIVTALDLEVDRVEVRRAGRRSLVQIYLDGDGPEGRGPSLDEIADATRAISAAMDESSVMGDAPYTLEVSSRGVSRPLTEPKHFRRNLGRLASITVPDGEVTGRIAAVTEEAVTLDVDGADRVVPFGGIGKAVIQVEFNRPADEEE